jgi:hypothetical protein
MQAVKLNYWIKSNYISKSKNISNVPSRKGKNKRNE